MMRRARSWSLIGVIGIISTFLLFGAVPAAASSLSTTTHITKGMSTADIATFTEKAGARAVSHDGRYSVFATNSSQLTFNDVNGSSDIFMYDRETKLVSLISKSPYGPQANGFSYGATISPNGRYVVFFTYATNIVPGEDLCIPGNVCVNIIVHDRFTKSNTRVNKASDGSRLIPSSLGGATLSNDGRYVAFNTSSNLTSADNNVSTDVAVRDLVAGTTVPASMDSNGKFRGGSSESASISYDGKHIAFTSRAPLVPEDTNNSYDVYHRNLQTNVLKRISVATGGQQANNSSYHAVISGDGKFVAFDSTAYNLVPNDTNGQTDVFLHDIQAASTKRVSTTGKGVQGNDSSEIPDISYDGKYVVYLSRASNLVQADNNGYPDIFQYYRDNSLTRRINVQSGNGAPAVGGGSYEPSVSGDGKAVFFDSDAKNLVAQPPNPANFHFYLTYNPVVHIPFYDPNDIADLMF